MLHRRRSDPRGARPTSSGLTTDDRHTCPQCRQRKRARSIWQHGSRPAIWHEVASDGSLAFLNTHERRHRHPRSTNGSTSFGNGMNEISSFRPLTGTALNEQGARRWRSALPTSSSAATDGEYDSHLEVFATDSCGDPSCTPREMALESGGANSIGPSVFVDDMFFIDTNDLCERWISDPALNFDELAFGSRTVSSHVTERCWYPKRGRDAKTCRPRRRHRLYRNVRRICIPLTT